MLGGKRMERSELESIKENLALLDEVTILDLLGIVSDDLVERFEDYIVDNYETVSKAIKTR